MLLHTLLEMAHYLGHQPIKYYICTGLDPTEDFKKPIKIYGIVEIGSLVFNIFVAAKIYRFKKKDNSEGKKLKSQFG